MQIWLIAIVVVALAIVIGAGAWLVSRRRRTEQLSRHYGPEYQATLEAAGSRDAAERELEARSERVGKLEITPLSGEQRGAFAEEWRETQARFVDDPGGAIAAADLLVQEVMRARGYPTGDFERRAADVSVDHPQVVAEYRAAHRIAERHAADGVETEDLRQAMVHYRALFNDLLQADVPEPALTSGGTR